MLAAEWPYKILQLNVLHNSGSGDVRACVCAPKDETQVVAVELGGHVVDHVTRSTAARRLSWAGWRLAATCRRRRQQQQQAIICRASCGRRLTDNGLLVLIQIKHDTVAENWAKN